MLGVLEDSNTSSSVSSSSAASDTPYGVELTNFCFSLYKKTHSLPQCKCAAKHSNHLERVDHHDAKDWTYCHSHLLALARTCSHLLTLAPTCSHLLALARTCSHLLTLACTCLHLLALAHTCSHLLALAHTCSTDSLTLA